jgi:hypothetical protein
MGLTDLRIRKLSKISKVAWAVPLEVSAGSLGVTFFSGLTESRRPISTGGQEDNTQNRVPTNLTNEQGKLVNERGGTVFVDGSSSVEERRGPADWGLQGIS